LIIEALQMVYTEYSGLLEIVFAGKADGKSRKLVSDSIIPNVVHLDNYLTDLDYAELLNSSDLILLPYSNRGSSGIVLESLSRGKPVIMARSRIWESASEHSKGLIHFSKLNGVSLARTIIEVLESEPVVQPVILQTRGRLSVVDFLLKDL
jgi:glycosyltransferase involved in cell wall biosynthesis